MKTFLIIIALLVAAVIGWYIFNYYQSAASKPVVVNTRTTDTMVIVKDSIINARGYDSIPTGFYQGMLPCKNCEGIQRTILFGDNGHYKMEELNWGKGMPAKSVEGTWEKEKGRFKLYENEKPIAEYRLYKDSLINTESNGTPIPIRYRINMYCFARTRRRRTLPGGSAGPRVSRSWARAVIRIGVWRSIRINSFCSRRLLSSGLSSFRSRSRCLPRTAWSMRSIPMVVNC